MTELVSLVVVAVLLASVAYTAYKGYKVLEKKNVWKDFENAVEEAVAEAEAVTGKFVKEVDETVDDLDDYAETAVDYIKDVYSDTLVGLSWDDEQLHRKLKAHMRKKKSENYPSAVYNAGR